MSDLEGFLCPVTAQGSSVLEWEECFVLVHICASACLIVRVGEGWGVLSLVEERGS